ncbi:Hypothetical predicted protein [Prunus dulcis]|uniref:Uncharacterized protein n=1 Tax=Prunus dulcis TaxID=3755 RepID=A0A5E4F146_PRUDU|nr:Hypothetical predicted protein [Prunus dulcis]
MSICMRGVPYRRNSRSDWGRSAIELQRRVSGGRYRANVIMPRVEAKILTSEIPLYLHHPVFLE